MEARDRKNGLKKENERQLTRKAEIMDKTAREENRRIQQLRELTKQRGGTTAEAKDKENGLTKRKKDSGN